MLVKDILFTLPVPQFDLSFLNHRIHLSQSIAHNIRTVIFLAQILIEGRMDIYSSFTTSIYRRGDYALFIFQVHSDSIRRLNEQLTEKVSV